MHRRTTTWGAILGAALWLVSPGARADLASYIARPESQYHWEKASETQEGFITVTDLKLRSQEIGRAHV